MIYLKSNEIIDEKMEKVSASRSKLVCFVRPRYAPVKRKSLHRNVRSRTHADLTGKKSSTYTYDPCGLNGNYDSFSDDEVAQKTKEIRHVNRSIRSQILTNKSTTKEIQQKFELIDKESAKVQTKMKSLLRSILKKDKVIHELEELNCNLKEQLQESARNNTIQNGDLIELANTNNRLQKEIEKKHLEMSTLQTKINKSEFIRTNLLKDIDFYKSELSAARSENVAQEQRFSEQEYEKIQRKFYEIKVENSKLCRKFKEIRSPEEETCPKSNSYHVLCKKFETVQHDMTKLKMENKRLKERIRKNQKYVCDDETSEMIKTSTTLMNVEIENLTQIKRKLETENEDRKMLLEELQLEADKTRTRLVDLQSELEERTNYCRLCEEKMKHFENRCTALENQLKTILGEKEEVLKQHRINEQNYNALKLKLAGMTRAKSEVSTQKDDACSTDEENFCENCLLLKQEIEKLGYANLRLNKEKQNLQTNFQKLSVKTSKLTLKMEELEQEAQNKPKQGEDRGNDDTLLQQNVLLSRRLHDLLKKSEKLFKAHAQLQAKSEKDVNFVSSNDKIIEELNENLTFSKSNLEMIENKLNEEEWKLNAALKHIKQVKEQIKMEV